MNINFRMAIISGTVICVLSMQPTCQAQSTTSGNNKTPVPQAAKNAAPVQTALVDFPVLEAPVTGTGAPSSDGVDPSSPATSAAATTSSSPAPAVTSVTLPLKNEAVVKELVEVKKQFAQMEAEMKARMAKL